ncbi:MAG: nuclear transport factor 2 family protein, partial [Acidimicrobiia bacterium]
ALERAGHVRYVLDGTFVGTDSVIIVYTCKVPDGPDRTGSDIMTVNADGKIVDWRSHYTFSPDDAPELIKD